MKTTKKILLTALMIVLSAPTMFAQLYEWQMSPKPNEEYIGMISQKYDAGAIFYAYEGHRFANGQTVSDYRKTVTDAELYEWLLSLARSKYFSVVLDKNIPTTDITLRNFKSVVTEERVDMPESYQYKNIKYYNLSASVVIPANKHVSQSNTYDEDEDDLTRALDKALQDIREGSRIAIDQVKVLSGMDKNEYKDQIVEILIDKGYKVVAKEYLEKLYDEQQAQQSGIYNDRTTVKENNFSAVGYYLNVRLTETSLRVQVINVSTGEYDANVTIKL